MSEKNPNSGALWKPQVSSTALLNALMLSSHCQDMPDAHRWSEYISSDNKKPMKLYFTLQH